MAAGVRRTRRHRACRGSNVLMDAPDNLPMVRPPVVVPSDIVTGLGTADRALLATSLALFEDSKLARRIRGHYDLLSKKVAKWVGTESDTSADSEPVASVRSRMRLWRDSKWSDDQMRLVLWIYLREAFGLPPKLCVSARAAGLLGDDLSAAALSFVGPSFLERFASATRLFQAKEHPVSLDGLVRPIVSEMLASALQSRSIDPEAKERLVNALRSQIEGMREADRERLMRELRVDELNDAAIRNILVTGGGFAAFGAGVGAAGFSAYILAAQASAFIPLVSGPGLVSLVAVLANPITAIAATAGIGWWVASDASARVRAEVAIRVISLLALQAVSNHEGGARNLLSGFAQIGTLSPFCDLRHDVLSRYLAIWRTLEPATKNAPVSEPLLADAMSRLARSPESARGEGTRLARLLGEREELENTAALAVLTLGELAYSAASIDPTVVAAVDFARAADLHDPIAFAAFADQVEGLNPAARLGAISDVKGYVAERVVAAKLVSQGHQVEFPASANQEGWDISVDGEHFQIKDVATAEPIAHHFDSFEYPVIANAEVALAEHGDSVPPWADDVFFLEGYTNESVQRLTESSIDAGSRMLNPHVPLFALGVSAARNFTRMQRGEVTAAQAMQQVVFDGSTRMGLAAIGGFAGKSIGLLVFGPAGALVLASALPILAQRQSKFVQGVVDQWITSDAYAEWKSDTQAVLGALTNTLERAMETKLAILRKREGALGDGEVAEYVRWRICDDICFLIEQRCLLQASSHVPSSSVEARAAAVLAWLPGSTIHPRLYQSELNALSVALGKRPAASDRLSQRGVAAARATVGFGRRLLSKWRDMVAELSSSEITAEQALELAATHVGGESARSVREAGTRYVRDGWPDGAYRISNEPVWAVSVPDGNPMRVGADRVVCVSKIGGKVVFDGPVGE